MIVEVKVVNGENEAITSFSQGITLEDRVQLLVGAVQNELSIAFDDDEGKGPFLKVHFDGKLLQKERKFKDYLDLLKSNPSFPNSLTFVAQMISRELPPSVRQSLQAENQLRSSSCRSSRALFQPNPAAQQKYRQLVELATRQFSLGLKQNAIKNLRKALQMEVQGSDNINANIEFCLGFLKNSLGNLDETLAHFQKGLEIFFNVYGVKCELTGCITANIGSVFLELEDLIQALEFQKSAKIINENLENTDHLLTTINYNLGLVHFKMGNYNLSLEICKKSLEESLCLFGENDVRVGDLFNLIADNLWKMCIYEDSLEFLNKSEKIYLEVLGDCHLKSANVFEKQAMYFGEVTQEFDVAEELMLKALDIKQAILGKHPVVADCYFNLSRLHLIKDATKEAIVALEKCYEILKHVMAQLSPSAKADPPTMVQQKLTSKLTKTAHMLITLLYNDSQFERASQILASFEKLAPRDVVGRSLRCFITGVKAMVTFFTGNSEKAYHLATESVEYCKDEYGPKHCKTLEAFFRLGFICKEMGKMDEALIYFSSASEPGEGEDLPESSTYFKFRDDMKQMMEEIN